MNAKEREQFNELKEKAALFDLFYSAEGSTSSKTIAESFGITALRLHKILVEAGILKKVANEREYRVMAKFADAYPRVTASVIFTDSKGKVRRKDHKRWTEQARRNIVRLLIEKGYEPKDGRPKGGEDDGE